MAKYLVFDWGGTTIKTGLYENDVLTAGPSIPTPASWQEMKDVLLAQKNQNEGLDGIAISSPGAVDTEQGIIFGASAIDYIHNFKIRDELEAYLGLPVSMQNDANCAALAELWKGNARDVDNTLVIVIGSGIGGGVLLDKALKTGQDLFAGEFGYMVLDWKSGATFSELTSPVWISREFEQETGKALDGAAIFNLADDGDATAQKYVERFYKSLACGIFNLLVSFNPNRVLIGGGISKREGMIETLQQYLDELIQAKHADGLCYELNTCQFFNDSNMLGAVYQFELEHPSLHS